MKLALMLAITMAGAAAVSAAAVHRSSAEVRKFRKLTGCHAIVDHRIPLCAGGPDTADNMQCQRAADAAAKDRFEKQLCAEMKRQHFKLVKEG